jgi:hypothetical protein
MADQACSELPRPRAAGRTFEGEAWARLRGQGSLARFSPSRLRIIPKTHFAGRGVTIRSFSRYLALCYEAVDLRWRRIDPDVTPTGSRRDHTILLVPWPLEVRPDDFRPVTGPLENMDPESFGFFEFAPPRPLDVAHLTTVVELAHREAGRIDALVLPEGAIADSEVPALEELGAEHDISLLVAGVRGRRSDGHFGRNVLHLAVLTSEGWQRYQQSKHHRWCLDAPQIRQYHLSRVLDPRKRWWEAIDLPTRTLEIIDLGRSATVAALVCEDLARIDEAADVLRRIGPTLIFALLLDGPQLATRWPCRYASVLADDPGSAVLTLTSFGMATRSRPAGMRSSRVVALWNDPTGGLHELELARGASGILLTASLGRKTVWTADGRCHTGSTPDVVLSDVRQLRR